MGLVGAESVSVYISVCAALAATGGTTTQKLVKWSPTHLKPYPNKAPATETHPPEAPPTETHQPKAPSTETHQPEAPPTETHPPEALYN